MAFAFAWGLRGVGGRGGLGKGFTREPQFPGHRRAPTHPGVGAGTSDWTKTGWEQVPAGERMNEGTSIARCTAFFPSLSSPSPTSKSAPGKFVLNGRDSTRMLTFRFNFCQGSKELEPFLDKTRSKRLMFAVCVKKQIRDSPGILVGGWNGPLPRRRSLAEGPWRQG